MTPEQLDKARADDAFHYAEESDPAANQSEKLRKAFERYRAHTLSNWTPPDPISPRVLAAREWLKGNTVLNSDRVAEGNFDASLYAKAFLAGFAAAVKLAEPIMTALQRMEPISGGMITTYRQSIGESHEGQ